MNHEIYSLYDVDVVQLIQMQRMRWLGHEVPMDENAKVFNGKVESGKSTPCRACLRWKDQLLAGLLTGKRGPNIEQHGEECCSVLPAFNLQDVNIFITKNALLFYQRLMVIMFTVSIQA